LIRFFVASKHKNMRRGDHKNERERPSKTLALQTTDKGREGGTNGVGGRGGLYMQHASRGEKRRHVSIRWSGSGGSSDGGMYANAHRAPTMRRTAGWLRHTNRGARFTWRHPSSPCRCLCSCRSCRSCRCCSFPPWLACPLCHCERHHGEGSKCMRVRATSCTACHGAITEHDPVATLTCRGVRRTSWTR